MATIWLTCRRPFDRHNLQVNTTIRDMVKRQIVTWTGWSGSPHDVQWKLRIEQQAIGRRDSVVYFVGSFSSGVVRPRMRQDYQNANDSQRAELREREIAWANDSRSRPPTHLGATVAEAPAASEVWIEACLFQIFGLGAHRPNWSPVLLDRTAKILAAVALHELAHNKVEPVQQRSNPAWNLHNPAHGGGRIFTGVPSYNIQPSTTNMNLLRTHVAAPRQQEVLAHPAFAAN